MKKIKKGSEEAVATPTAEDKPKETKREGAGCGRDQWDNSTWAGGGAKAEEPA